jgi:hypothetical protein
VRERTSTLVTKGNDRRPPHALTVAFLLEGKQDACPPEA